MMNKIDFNMILAFLIIFSATIVVCFNKIESGDYMIVITGCIGFLGSQILSPKENIKENNKNEY